MFGISFGELLVIALIGLILFGPERLPEMARTFGKFVASVNQTMQSVQREYQQGLKTENTVIDVSASETGPKSSLPPPDSLDGPPVPNAPVSSDSTTANRSESAV